MIVSDKRREANRRNSLKSTGPTSPEGKDRSRENAIKHGLTALVVAREDPAAMQDEAEAMFYSLRPRNRFQAGLVDQVAVINLRTRRAQRIERKLRDQVALRAVTSWDDDRRFEAERLARDLPDRPSEVLAGLRRTPQGCDLIAERWAMLAHAAAGGWSEAQRRLAFDLLGTPPEFRAGEPGLVLDAEGLAAGPAPDPLALARGQIASTREARDRAEEHDAIARELAEADLTDEPGPEIRRLRRYESGLHKRLRWALATLKDPVPENRPPHDLKPAYTAQTEEEYQAEVDAEMHAKAETDARFEAEYYAKKAREKEEAEAKEAKKAEAKAKREAKAREREEARLKAQDEATPEAQDEATPEAQNEATPEMRNEAIIEPTDEPEAEPAAPEVPVSDRRESKIRQADDRREAKKRKLDRKRA